MTERRRPMRRIVDLLPGVASELGLEKQLAMSRGMASWARLVAELVPAASGESHLVSIQPPVIVVSASLPIVAQELRLRSRELLAAFASAPGGVRALELRVVIRDPPGAPEPHRRRSPPL